MQTRSSFVVAASFVGALLVACSSETVVNGNTSPEAACAQAAESICTKFNGCAPLLIQSVYGSVEECGQRAQIDCVAGLKANGTATTPDDAVACGDAFASSSCDAVVGGHVEACWTKAGTLADGTVCSVDAQCAGKSCRKGDGATCGACSTRAASGGSCTTDKDCAEPLDCIGGKCATRGEVGAACSDDAPCLETLRCQSGVCAKGLAAGAACTPGEDACDLLAGLFCNPKTKVCATVKLVAPGEPCGFIDGAFVGCSRSGSCKGATAATPGTCLAVAADGQPCDAEKGPDCLPPATCLNAVCTLSDANACR